jgi:hypothetical protein
MFLNGNSVNTDNDHVDSEKYKITQKYNGRIRARIIGTNMNMKRDNFNINLTLKLSIYKTH